jgi:uncharacterized protein
MRAPERSEMATTKKPTSAEDEYIAREEKQRQELAKIAREQQEKEAARAARRGTCPLGCETKLVEETFQHIKIDRCPTCKGVWLDPGELEQIASDSSGIVRSFVDFLSKRGA